MLAHLAALGVLHVAHDQAVLVRALAEHQRGDGDQGVEPAARLVDGLGDEVRREALLENFLVLKGIVPLREGHGAGIVPAVDDLGRAVHLLSALRAGDGHRVDVGAMQLDVRVDVFAQLDQLLTGADDVLVAALADPHRQGRAPVALAGERPVDDVVQEVAEAAVLDVLRHPVDGLVVGHQLVVHGGHLDEPAAARVVDQRGVAAPAEGIVVLEHRRGDQLAFAFQLLQDDGIGLLDEGALPGGLLAHLALGRDQLEHGDVVVAAHARVILTEGGGDVHDAGTVGHGDVAVGDDLPGVARVGHVAQCSHLEVEQRLIFDAHQRTAGEGGLVGNLNALAQNLLDQRVAHDDGAALVVELRVGLVGVDAQRHVAGQGPGGGGPCVNVGVLLILDLEAHHGGAFLHQLVALGDLVAGEGGAAAGAVGNDLVALVQQALLADLLEAPPLGFDVVVLIGDVGILHVAPEADAVGHLLPHALVLPHGFLALPDEGLQAVLLDLLLAVQAQLLLDLQLDGQAVGVPAGLAQHVLALHGLIARDQILDGAGLDVADVGLAVGRRRAVKEGEGVLTLAQVDALFEDLVFFPELQNLLLAGKEVHRGGNFLKHAALLQIKIRPHPFGTKALRGTTQIGAGKPHPLDFCCNGRSRRGLLTDRRSVRCSEAIPCGCSRPDLHQSPARCAKARPRRSSSRHR